MLDYKYTTVFFGNLADNLFRNGLIKWNTYKDAVIRTDFMRRSKGKLNTVQDIVYEQMDDVLETPTGERFCASESTIRNAVYDRKRIWWQTKEEKLTLEELKEKELSK